MHGCGSSAVSHYNDRVYGMYNGGDSDDTTPDIFEALPYRNNIHRRIANNAPSRNSMETSDSCEVERNSMLQQIMEFERLILRRRWHMRVFFDLDIRGRQQTAIYDVKKTLQKSL